MTDNLVPAPTSECIIEPIDIPHVYTPLFRSNVCPSTEACTNIKSLIEDHERQLVTVQDHVDRLRTRLTDMERHQVHTQDVLVKLHATLTPIKRLPPEILSEIFEYCLDAKNASVRFSAAARNKEPPLLLARVCRSWRAITHATPRLWRDVFVNVCEGRFSHELRRDALPALQTWLVRSGSLPLNLIVLCKTERVLPGLVDLFDIIAAHAVRWRTVHVCLQNSAAIYGLVCRAFTNCTSLSTFNVTDGSQCVSIFGPRQPVRFDLSLAPLHQLSLSLSGLAIRDVHAPWATLTHLSFMQDTRTSTSSITDYAAILRQCTSLKKCSITIDSGIRDTPLEPFTLPSLECLDLQLLRRASQTTQTGDFLNALNAPRLHSLSVEDYCPRQDAVLYHGQLKAFLQAHRESLQRFRFSTSSQYFTSGDMILLIVETPLLTELEYRPDEESSPKLLLEALMPFMKGDVLACLLPRLERLCVYWDTSETVSMVGDMIEKRYALFERGIARLKYLSCKPVRISMVYDCMPSNMLVENLATRLKPLSQSGLRVDWEAYTYDLEFSYC